MFILNPLNKLHRGQRGMTGLETAIILIAFVTVAAVLAYSVLSAGVYSAEKGKSTVYKGLESAEATMEVYGSVLGLSPNTTKLEQVIISLGLTIPQAKVDMTSIIVNYFDNAVHSENVTVSAVKNPGSTERGTSTMLEADEQFILTVTIPAAANISAYGSFTIQIIPPTGATITIERTVPGYLDAVMDLQ